MTARVASNFTSTSEYWPGDSLEDVGACPACGCTGRRLLYKGLTDRTFGCAAGQWSLWRCTGCSAAYLDPRPAAEAIGHAYSNYYTHAGGASRSRRSELPFVASLINGFINHRYGYDMESASVLGRLLPIITPYRAAWAAKQYVRHLPPLGGRRLLDVGAGDGQFIGRIARFGWHAKGVEPDERAAETARRLGLDVEQATLHEFARHDPRARFDALTLNHVIEHLPDPLETLVIGRSLLTKGGRIWIATPNLGSRGHSRFGRHWVHLDPPRHLVLFDTRALSKLLRRAGYTEIRQHRPVPNAALELGASSNLARDDEARLDGGLTISSFRSCLWTSRELARPERSTEVVLSASP
jgi:2-polyprenyl-3-methyl-5-hydroxy-6-metoxy-1,4-benzoquinol methylase